MTVRTITSSLGARALKTRWLVRSPIWLYRAGLGFLFGSRILMLEHRGRTSGARRFVMLEVVDHPAHDEYIVVAGFGQRAQWYRNILADPNVRVSCGLRRSVAATADPMTDEESAAELKSYAERHPKAWASLRATIEAAVGHPVDGLPMVRVRWSKADDVQP
jgi:deazaflavin-dependent oxidoreductase (nitroreductase family)